MAAALGPYIAVSGVRGGVRWFGLGVGGGGGWKCKTYLCTEYKISK